MLQVRVGHEADDGVERQGRLHVADAVGVEDPDALNAQDQVADGHHDRVGSHQSQSVLSPVHTLMGIHAADFVNDAVQTVKDRVGQCVVPCGDMIHIPSNRNDNDQKDDDCQRQLQHIVFLLFSAVSGISETLRMHQRVNEISAQQQNDNSKCNHGYDLLSALTTPGRPAVSDTSGSAAIPGRS